MKDVMLRTGAGQIGMAIARGAGFNKIIAGDKKLENAHILILYKQGYKNV